MINKNTKQKVSVIVPVYNTSEYLERCFESITNQTLKEIEIIAVNDGSTDNSLSILEQFQNVDTRIKVISINNKGVSNARNIGIENANGEYVTFVDSDDWIDTNMLSEMWQIAVDNSCDVVLSTYVREYTEGSKIKKLEYNNIEFFDSNDVKYKLYRRMIGPIGAEIKDPSNIDSLIIPCSKLYKTKVLKENNIFFEDINKVGAEDCLFNIEVFNYVKKAIFINKPFYHYWKGNTQSITSVYKREFDKKRYELYTRIENILVNNKKGKIYFEALNNRVCINTLGLILNECCNREDNVLTIVGKIKEILCNDKIKEAFKEFSLEYLPLHWKIFYFLIKRRLAYSTYIMGLIINKLRQIA